MPNDVGTLTRITISSSSQGNKRLKFCESSDVKDGSSVEAVNNMGDDDPIGVIEKPGPYTISLSIYEEKGTPEIDYRALKRSKEWFSTTREIVGGKRFQYPRCRVSTVEPKSDNEGKAMLDVEIVALSERPL